MESAKNVIEQTETLRLSKAGAEALFEALENPPKANKKLQTAAQRVRDSLNADHH